MSDEISDYLRELAQMRAHRRCEYCLLHEEDARLPHEPDHIIARKHRGLAISDNLAWACFVCNRFKGSDIASIDVETGRLVRLLDPRQNVWSEHFRLEGARIIPLTAEGHVTEHVLQLNLGKRIRIRRALLVAGRYPR
jgi:hypothetical protein